MRTGSIGNRDAETLINSLVEPKKTILGDLRRALLDLGYSEEAGYDPINIESFVTYAIRGNVRFIFKHKWNLSVTLVLASQDEFAPIKQNSSDGSDLAFEKNENGTVWVELDPKEKRDLILSSAKYFASTK